MNQINCGAENQEKFGTPLLTALLFSAYSVRMFLTLEILKYKIPRHAGRE
jgi:hypothetical protein